MIVDINSKTTTGIRYLFIAVLLRHLGSDLAGEDTWTDCCWYSSVTTTYIREAACKLHTIFIVHLLEIATIWCDRGAPILRAVVALTPMRVLHEILVLDFFDYSLLWNFLKLIPHHLKLHSIVIGLKHLHEMLCLMVMHKENSNCCIFSH